jgi:uncharacterized protein YgiB involved in biofilm formation
MDKSFALHEAIPSKQLIVSLMSLSLISTSALILYGCESERSVDAVFYSSAQQCIQDKRFTQQFCQSEWNKAVQLNNNAAPTYEAKEDCQKENEDCETVSNGGRTVYRPRMTGYITHSSPYQNSDSDVLVVTQPIYGSSKTGYITANRTPIEISSSTSTKTGATIVRVPHSTAISKPTSSRPVAKGTVTKGSYGKSLGKGKGGS